MSIKQIIKIGDIVEWRGSFGGTEYLCIILSSLYEHDCWLIFVLGKNKCRIVSFLDTDKILT